MSAFGSVTLLVYGRCIWAFVTASTLLNPDLNKNPGLQNLLLYCCAINCLHSGLTGVNSSQRSCQTNGYRSYGNGEPIWKPAEKRVSLS